MAPLLPVLTMALMAFLPPCDAPESAALDFWIGDWTVTWDGGEGHDRVIRREEGCIVDDRFDDGAGAHLRSSSVWTSAGNDWAMMPTGPFPGYQLSPSVYFMGRSDGGDYVFEESVGSAPVYHRIVFSDIRKDSFTWHWQAAPDRKTWTDTLVARYVRLAPKPPPPRP